MMPSSPPNSSSHSSFAPAYSHWSDFGQLKGSQSSWSCGQSGGSSSSKWRAFRAVRERWGATDRGYFEEQRRDKTPHVLCVDTGRSSETAKAHRG
eukprot:TRINITY_DN14013_c0_g1_i1.p1 TRINITY_DN14013_c0_g1~~TRINITY_DN14013_c0_g1_i1.p1  ORF type:complete len:95 (-),score=9.91 TRINITY_DN14013_c0_g1_i1:2-286(-)